MGLLLLLSAALLCRYFQSGRVVNAMESFFIDSITLSIEPHTDVPRNTNVTLRCKVKVIQGSEVLSREYGLYKDNEIIYNKTTSSSEDFLYHLPEVRVSNNGRYSCKISIKGQLKTSRNKRLTVSGLAEPVLRINQSSFSEGEEFSAWCSAPGETGSFIFYYYDNSEEIQLHHGNHDTSLAKILLNDVGRHDISCSYSVVLKSEPVPSVGSNTVTVAVTELSITPVLEISPQENIYEGDRLRITCTVSGFLQSSQNMQLILSQENRMLIRGQSDVNYSMMAPPAAPSHAFQCMLMVGSVKKVDTKTVPVKELFSVPTLSMRPPEVFQREPMTLTCRSDRVAHERLDGSQLNYTLYPVESLIPRGSGVFFGKALLNDFNYTCAAQAKGVEKYSKTLTVRPKVFVSTPEISVTGRVILGQPFQILCQSVRGSLPITYTLFKDYQQIGKNIVQYPRDKALFTVTINHTREISKFICEANNKNNNEGILSGALNATVIVPLGQPVLSVVPNQQELSEGNNLNLLCTVNGTPPITFRWYREGDAQPVSTTTSDRNFKDYEVSVLSKQHSGKYFCEAENRANNKVRSKLISIEVHMAQWKKALIWGVVLLVVSVLVLVGCVLYFKSKRDAVSFYDGKEGRVTNGTRGSMASLPADISNRSSYSIPATV
ncbi:platelet endothelial cell adhesion molecule isoform X4 [Leuresthes tenuis]|uniref:platelet endothelial cell adhesion molecule isoform X4 n=1 Tax=Leuresthes tenuis TaxID=355514 RepID=UPI003B4FFADE